MKQARASFEPALSVFTCGWVPLFNLMSLLVPSPPPTQRLQEGLGCPSTKSVSQASDLSTQKLMLAPTPRRMALPIASQELHLLEGAGEMVQ